MIFFDAPAAHLGDIHTTPTEATTDQVASHFFATLPAFLSAMVAAGQAPPAMATQVQTMADAALSAFTLAGFVDGGDPGQGYRYESGNDPDVRGLRVVDQLNAIVAGVPLAGWYLAAAPASKANVDASLAQLAGLAQQIAGPGDYVPPLGPFSAMPVYGQQLAVRAPWGLRIPPANVLHFGAGAADNGDALFCVKFHDADQLDLHWFLLARFNSASTPIKWIGPMPLDSILPYIALNPEFDAIAQ